MPGPAGAAEVLRAVPGAGPVLELVARTPEAWVVGGAVRDALLGRVPRELDIVVEGDAEGFAAALGEPTAAHERFGTVSVDVPDGPRVDVVRARAERYAAPGALPDVRAGTLEEDLARRDLTINAIAWRPEGLRSVAGGMEDLADGVCRVLHDASFVDDPTRLWRTARYAARLGFEVEERTRVLAALADPSTVSGPRHGAEVRRTLAERDPLGALRLARELNERLLPPGFVTAPEGLEATLELLRDVPGARRELVVLAACCGNVDAAMLVAWLSHLAFTTAEREVAGAGSRASTLAPLRRASSPSEIARAARGVPLEVVALAGGEAARRWIDELRHVRLAITGDDLLAAGVPEGPEVGRRLASVLDLRLDGQLAAGREAELAAALSA